jgi:hypothetical protein
MLKTITMITKFILIALTVLLLFASCNQSINLKAITGSGHVTTRTELYKESLKVLKLAMLSIL